MTAFNKDVYPRLGVAMNIPEIANITHRGNQYLQSHVKPGYLVNGDDFGACGRCLHKHKIRNFEPMSPHVNYVYAPECMYCKTWLYGGMQEDEIEHWIEELERRGFNHKSGKHCYIWMVCENVASLHCEHLMGRLFALAGLEKGAVAS